MDVGRDGQIRRLSHVMKYKILIQDDQPAGQVVDFVLSDGGCIDYIVAVYDDRYYAIPYSAATVRYADSIVFVDLAPARFEQIQFFTADNWPDFYVPAYRNQVFSTFGVDVIRREGRATFRGDIDDADDRIRRDDRRDLRRDRRDDRRNRDDDDRDADRDRARDRTDRNRDRENRDEDRDRTRDRDLDEDRDADRPPVPDRDRPKADPKTPKADPKTPKADPKTPRPEPKTPRTPDVNPPKRDDGGANPPPKAPRNPAPKAPTPKKPANPEAPAPK
jgi:hypothetical protein